MSKVIRVTVDPDGNVGADFSGFVGGECQAADERLRAALAALGLQASVKASTHKRDALTVQSSGIVRACH